MGTHPGTPDKSHYWTALGVSLGAGIGLLAGLFGWGPEGLALGITFGAGIGVALGAGLDARGPRGRGDGEELHQ
jgi:hypothetical protein